MFNYQWTKLQNITLYKYSREKVNKNSAILPSTKGEVELVSIAGEGRGRGRRGEGGRGGVGEGRGRERGGEGEGKGEGREGEGKGEGREGEGKGEGGRGGRGELCQVNALILYRRTSHCTHHAR